LFKEQNLPQGANMESMYFGLQYGDGHTNQEFGDTIEAISLYTDDTIFSASYYAKTSETMDY